LLRKQEDQITNWYSIYKLTMSYRLPAIGPLLTDQVMYDIIIFTFYVVVRNKCRYLLSGNEQRRSDLLFVLLRMVISKCIWCTYGKVDRGMIKFTWVCTLIDITIVVNAVINNYHQCMWHLLVMADSLINKFFDESCWYRVSVIISMLSVIE